MNKKRLLLVLCVVAMVAAVAAGTIAYFVDQDKADNTFTVGSVGLTLDEADVKPDGTLDTENRVQENTYHLLPGRTYIKDPTVTVEAGSSLAYVRMLVNVENINDLKDAIPMEAYYYNGDTNGMFLLQKLCGGWDSTTWLMTGYHEETTADGVTGVYEFRYHEPVAESETATELPALFETITVPGEVDNEGVDLLQNVVIHVVAHAVQAEGFDGVDAAWAAFDEQNS